MQTTIDRNVDKALSQSESISQTQERARIQIGSDEFLDLALGLKNNLIQATDQLKGLNSSLICTFNRSPEGVTELLPKLDALANSCIGSVRRFKGGVLATCIGGTVLSGYQIEIDQLNETIEDIKYKAIGPSEDLQALFDQL